MPAHIRSYRDLLVWQRAMELGVAVTLIARALPRPDQWVFDVQTRRAAWSIAANIAEGHERRHPREFLQHVFIARGSLAEVETFMEAIERTAPVDATNLKRCRTLCDETGRMLTGLAVTLRNKVRGNTP